MYTVQVKAKLIPSWVTVTVEEASSALIMVEPSSGAMKLEAGESIALRVSLVDDFASRIGSTASLSNTAVTEAFATVSFGVLGLDHPGCQSQDKVFDVSLRITPMDTHHHLGSIRYVGFTFMGIILLSSLFFAVWVWKNRAAPSVVTMQPNFLVILCSGIFIIGLTIVPMSIDDAATQTSHGCDIACMASPWLLSSGLTIAFSALISKLWRVNRIFGAESHRRIVVRERDVLAPFAILSTLNAGLLLAWTLVDPLRWERRPSGDDSWNTYGSCITGQVGNTLFGFLVAVHVSALLYLCFHAYKARNVSESLSESKHIGFAIFSWLEVVLVGIPVMLLLRDDYHRVKYFLSVSLLFVLSMSMLLLIFCPLIMQHRHQRETFTSKGIRCSIHQLVLSRNRDSSRRSEIFGVSDVAVLVQPYENIPLTIQHRCSQSVASNRQIPAGDV